MRLGRLLYLLAYSFTGQALATLSHFLICMRYYDKKWDQVVASSMSMISMMPSSELIYGRLSSIYRKNFQPMLYFKHCNCFQKRSSYSRFRTYMMHIELLIFYRFTHSNLPTFSPALSKTYSNSYGHFLVSWGSKYPKYPFLALRNKCAYLGVPPMMAKKKLDPIISVKVSRQSFSALSRPIRDMISMTIFSFSVLIQLRKMELSLQTVTLQVRLKFYSARLMMNPASHGVYHQNSFLWGYRPREKCVKVCKENGISLLSQKSGAMVFNLACSFLKRRFAMAIWATRSMHPHPESDSQYVVGKTRLMLLRQVRRMYSQSSQTFLLLKKVSREANIRIQYQLISINNSDRQYSSRNITPYVGRLLCLQFYTMFFYGKFVITRSLIFHFQQIHFKNNYRSDPPTMSLQFQFSHTKNKQDPLFFRKSKGPPPGRPSLKPITESLDETEQHSKTHRGVVIEVKERKEHGLQQKCWKKYMNCLIRFWRLCFLSERKRNYDINNKDFESLIDKIKAKTYKFKTVLPPQKIPKKVLVLDLDETLVSSTFNKPPRFDFEAQFKMQGRNMCAYTVKRFGLEAFLYEMAQLYEIVIFTACNKDYACKVLQKIDPEGLISHRLFRQDGITVNGNTFLKNIAVLGRDPHNTILVDDNRFSGMLQPDNYYQIETFKGHQKDKKLLHLANFLKFAHKLERVTPIKEAKAAFHAQQITIDPPQQQLSESYPTHPSGLSKETRSHLQKKPSIDAQNWQTDFQSQGETTVTNLIKKF